MNINAVYRMLVSVGVITAFIAMCKDSLVMFFNVHMLILLSLVATHYRLSDYHPIVLKFVWSDSTTSEMDISKTDIKMLHKEDKNKL